MTKKKAPKSVTHSRTRLVGEPYEEVAHGYSDSIAVYSQKFETKGDPGISGTWEIKKLIKNYVLERFGDEIIEKTGKSLIEVWIEVFVVPNPAIIIIRSK